MLYVKKCIDVQTYIRNLFPFLHVVYLHIREIIKMEKVIRNTLQSKCRIFIIRTQTYSAEKNADKCYNALEV